MKKMTKALLGTGITCIGAGVALNSFALTRLSKKISDKMNEAEEKKNPKDMSAPKEQLRAKDSLWLEEHGYDHISIENRSGKHIHAYIVKAETESDKWAIFPHGYTSSPDKMGCYGLHYYEKGFNLLFPIMRGHTISEHHFITMGWLDRLDIVDWIQYLIDMYKDPQIVLHGESMGAATVMMTTGENLPFNVKCAVADCGYSSVWDEFGNELKNTYHLPKFPILYIADGVTKVLSGFGFKEASSIKQLQKSKTPTLFIHGEKDEFVPYKMMYKNYNAAVCEKEKLSVPDAEHAESLFVHPDLYWDNTFRFIDKYVK